MTGRAGGEGPRALTGYVFAVAFGYSAVAAALVQLVILPYVLPGWHAGDGLLAGGDWLVFHQQAVEAAERIRAAGWGTFRLRPLSNAPIGIASAIYALTWPKPWTLIPLNAALHATAATLLFHVLRAHARDWRWAAAGTAPFVFYPSALTWVSQIHKDGFAIAAYLCLFAAWSDLARDPPARGGWSTVVRALLLVPAGFGLFWLVRPDLVVALQAATGLALAVLGLAVATRLWRDPAHRGRRLAVLALVALTTLVSTWATHGTPRFGRARPAPAALQGGGAVTADPRVAPRRPAPHRDWPARAVTAIAWYPTPWLPAAADRIVYRIALAREVFLVAYLESRTSLDVDVGFHRATQVFRYVPRALQLGLLAPFPAQWRQAGSLAWTDASRRLVAIEMLGVYAGLVGLAVTAWRERRRPELWVVLLPCLALLTLYTLVVPNLGALHRFRYGFLMALVGIGIAGGLDWLAGARRRARRAPGGAGRRPPAGGPGES